MSRILLATLSLIGLLSAAPALADNYPSKPVRVIVPSSAGGIIDVLPRAILQKVSESTGQQFVVDNRPGAAGIIGSEAAMRAAPDGYTLLVVATAHAINAGLYPKLPYDTVRDFTPITMVARLPLYLVVHPSLGVNNVRELIAMAKAKPGQIFFASAGNGQGSHLAGEMFKSLAGINLGHVPYKGAGPALADVVAGQVPMLFNDPISAMPHIKSGKLKLLAVGTPKRSAAVPDTPTMIEAGVPGFDAYAWLGFLAPAGLSKDIATKLHAEITKAMNAPDVYERFFSPRGGLEVMGYGPDESAAFIKSEITKWTKVIKDSGAKPDQ